ncbi:MAG: alpha-L-arabinofuranosidase C-terminal domain-containing protein [Halobacteriales archaeon]|nr:alpha-L-arabinofuranosidase C-terminal domain-containing protein [Halobacteriales archaeon]
MSDDPVGRIAPEVFGHFAEHLGRCIYGGLWVGDDDRVETADGLRRDTLDLLSALEPPVLRWPGGCFADDYHWRDGIGPRTDRPTRRNLWWAQGRDQTFLEPNDFGTEEFLRLCRMLETKPYLAGNVGTGTPDELLDWVEYCNGSMETEPVTRRYDHGPKDPHDVRWWGIGNENWGCGGRFDPADYGRQYRTFANYLRAVDRHTDIIGDLELVGCGHITPDWNQTFLEAVEDPSLIDHLSIHRYLECGGDVEFSEAQYYGLLARARQVGADVDRAAATIEAVMPDADIGVIVDEWGVWHPQAVASNGLEQEQTVRDAIVAGGILNALIRRADIVTMANLAQTVNVLQCVVQTNETAAWPTPTYQVFHAYRPHMESTALQVDIQTETKDIPDEDHNLPLIDAAVSRTDDGLFATIVNHDLDGPRRVQLQPSQSIEDRTAQVTELFASLQVDAYSTRTNAGQFAPEGRSVDLAGDGTVEVELPAGSVTTVSIGG